MISHPLKSQSFRIAVIYIHLFLKHKSSRFINLSLFLHDVSIFWLKADPSGRYFIFILFPNLRDQFEGTSVQN